MARTLCLAFLTISLALGDYSQGPTPLNAFIPTFEPDNDPPLYFPMFPQPERMRAAQQNPSELPSNPFSPPASQRLIDASNLVQPMRATYEEIQYPQTTPDDSETFKHSSDAEKVFEPDNRSYQNPIPTPGYLGTSHGSDSNYHSRKFFPDKLRQLTLQRLADKMSDTLQDKAVVNMKREIPDYIASNETANAGNQTTEAVKIRIDQDFSDEMADKLKKIIYDKTGRDPETLTNHEEIIDELRKIVKGHQVQSVNQGTLYSQRSASYGEASKVDINARELLERLLISPTPNRTKIINWKVINHGSQTIIIL